MSDIATLKEMINETATVPLEENQDGKRLKHSAKLTEPQDSYCVTIYGMPANDEIIIIKADNFASPRSIFSGSKGECKRADFVIVADTAIEKIIICIEIKKTSDSNKTIIEQLTGAKCFVTYCQEIGKAFWKQPNFLNAYQYRFVSIGHISISKKTTRRKRKTDIERSSVTHDRPELMLKIKSPTNLQFNYLVEGEG
jgi:hypothetical protein